MHMSRTPGSHWRQWNGGELQFLSAFHWSGEIVHVLSCTATIRGLPVRLAKAEA